MGNKAVDHHKSLFGGFGAAKAGGREEVDHVSTSGGSKRGREGETDMDSTEIEAARKTVAKALYGNLGMLMHTHRTTRRRSPGVST